MPWNNPFPQTEFDLLGARIHRLARDQLLDCFTSALEAEGPSHFGYFNIAVSNLAHRDPGLKEILNRADLVYVDGAGVRLGVRILGGDCPPRNTGADFVYDVFEVCAQEGKTVGLLGGPPGAAVEFARVARGRVPDLQIVFVRDGFEDLRDAETTGRELSKNPPDLLLVGLGVPMQEEWIEKSRNKHKIRLYWSVGALFEYDGGTLKRCPAWMGRIGLEWLYRLIVEPGRLWKRYLIGNPRFLLRCLCSRWRGRGGIF